MDIRQLRYFLQVCNYGSILQTSQHVFISQQALSKTISSLENEIGLPLFHRTSRGLILTETGEQLRALAQPVVDSMDHLISEMSASARLNSTKFSLGVSSALQYFTGYDAVAQLSPLFPSAQFSLDEYPYNVCEQMVENGDLTAALTVGPVTNPALVTFPLIRRQRVAIVPKDSPLVHKKTISIRDLKGMRIATNINSRCYARLVRLCNEAGFLPDISRVGDNTTMLDLCNETGHIGVTIDFMLLRPLPPYENIVALPIDEDEISYPIELIVNASQYQRKIVQEFVEQVDKFVMNRNKRVPQYPFYFQGRASNT